MKMLLLFSIIAFILMLGFANTYSLVEQTYSQSSFQSSNKQLKHILINNVPFENLVKCIQSRACHPIMGSEGSDLIKPSNGSHVIMGLR